MEKNYNPEQKMGKTMNKQKVVEKIKIMDAPKEKTEIKTESEDTEIKKISVPETSKEAQKVSGKKKVERVKKEEAVVNAKSLPISTLFSIALCKFIKGKKIEKALVDLEEVLAKKKAVPIKGEYAHKKGKRMTSGKYPKNATEYFIKLIKSLQANSNYNGIENPIIVEAIANKASEPYGRFGKVRRKRTHVRLEAREKKK
ncbi:MAG: uL22 family ribosomal protein [Candidatus Pacearchaeota archaeon]